MRWHNLFIATTLVAGMMVSASANASPVYLSCTFMIDGKPSIIDFTLNEAQSSISRFVHDSGFNSTQNATFTADRIVFGDNRATFEIDRRHLTITRTIIDIGSHNKGTCHRQNLNKRISETNSSSSPDSKIYFVSGLDPKGDNWLALKQEPDIRSPRLRKLPPNTPLSVIGSKAGWYKVELDDGTKGWVSSRYVSGRPSD